MAKYTEEELEENKQRKELFELILKKSGISYREWLMLNKHNFVADNLDELTKAEKKQFDKLDLGVKKKRRFKPIQHINMNFCISIEEDEKTGWYVGQCIEIPSAMSQGKTIEELKGNIKEAIELVVEKEIKDESRHTTTVHTFRAELNIGDVVYVIKTNIDCTNKIKRTRIDDIRYSCASNKIEYSTEDVNHFEGQGWFGSVYSKSENQENFTDIIFLRRKDAKEYLDRYL